MLTLVLLLLSSASCFSASVKGEWMRVCDDGMSEGLLLCARPQQKMNGT